MRENQLYEPRSDEWTPVEGSKSQEVSHVRTSTPIVSTRPVVAIAGEQPDALALALNEQAIPTMFDLSGALPGIEAGSRMREKQAKLREMGV